MMYRVISGFLFFLLFAVSVHADVAINQPPAKPPGPLDTIASSDTETALLRSQIAQSERFQDQILSTVYWSLGTITAVTVLLVGFGWFSNFRIYEREKISLERELLSMIQSESLQLKADIQKITSQKFSEQDSLLKLLSSDSEARTYEAVAKLVKSVEQSFSHQNSSLNSSLARLNRDVCDLRIKYELNERKAYVGRKIYRNSLQCSVKALEFSVKVENEHSVGDVLDFISADISSILSSRQNPVDNFLVAKLVSALDSVEGSHAHAAATIKTQASRLLSGSEGV